MQKFTPAVLAILLASVFISLAFDEVVPEHCTKDTFCNPFKCCRPPLLLDNEIVSECLAKHNQTHPKLPECMSECLVNRTGIYEDSQDIDDKLALKVFKDNVAAKSIWTPVIVSATKECLAKAKKEAPKVEQQVEKLRAEFPKRHICSPMAGMIMECVHTTVYKNCPASLFNTTNPKCMQIKNFMSKCPPSLVFVRQESQEKDKKVKQ
ncbi:general odorant-binding protein 68-like [Uranotaenia lowii]|uniref:general odorant-binding protein 68-like n=1 Tax=Uranotaenia lowii TaxID=190385 RepID=UPI00247AACD9|nr:general odorant-binding protein 68-like [Uranotaenia lowii]